jgi:hypothetical protein
MMKILDPFSEIGASRVELFQRFGITPKGVDLFRVILASTLEFRFSVLAPPEAEVAAASDLVFSQELISAATQKHC